MAVTLSIQIPAASLAELDALLTPDQYRKATFQVVKRSGAKVLRLFHDEVKSQTFITPKYIKRAIALTPPKGDPPEARIIVSGKPQPLIAYKVRVNKRSGVTAQVSKGGTPITLRHAFKTTVATRGDFQGEHAGHTGIFSRGRKLPSRGPNKGKGKLTPQGVAGRFVIREHKGPSLASLISVPAVTQKINADTLAIMDKEVQSQLDRFLKPKAAAKP